MATRFPWRRVRNLLLVVLLGLAVGVPGVSTAPVAADEHTQQPAQAGSVWAWGRNDFGQLGDGTTTNRSAPVKVLMPSEMPTVVGVAGGTLHSLAWCADGSVWSWGINDSGVLGDGTTTDRLTPVEVLMPSEMPGVVGAARGVSHNLALCEDGSVWAWGSNDWGRLGDGTTTNRLTPVAVLMPSEMAPVVGVDCGVFHSLAVCDDGTLWAWGRNSNGQLGDGTQTSRSTPVAVLMPSEMPPAVGVAGGTECSFAWCEDGSVWAWGWNSHGQFGNGTTASSVTPVKVLMPDEMPAVVSVSATVSSCFAVCEDGSIWAWGNNSGGRLGDGTTTSPRLTPVPVQMPSEMPPAIGVSASNNVTVVVCVDGSLWAWGNNFFGAIGDGTTTNRLTPVPVLMPSEMPTVVGVTSGRGGHSLAFGLGPANTGPVAVASIVVDGEDVGDFVELPCEDHHGVLVTLDGSGSSDPDGDELDYEWSVAEDAGIWIDDPTAPTTEARFPVGVHEILLTVYDLDESGAKKGELGVATVTVVVLDDTPPVARVTTDLAALWPPNNKMVPVMIYVEASDACTDPDNLLIECLITSSQSDDSDGTGEHVGDVDGEDGFLSAVPVALQNQGDGWYGALVHLRAERDGAEKAGRLYSIYLKVIDGAGNVGQASTTVVVPHNGRKN